LIVRETVAIDTRARAATAWMSILAELSFFFFPFFMRRFRR
jgi:hypothetical protein